jgi:hypothetical protein
MERPGIEIDIRGTEWRAVKESFHLNFLWQCSFDEWELGQGEMLCILHFMSTIQHLHAFFVFGQYKPFSQTI